MRAFTIAVLALLATAAAAVAAPPAGTLATDASDGPIAAVGDTVAWSRWDDAAGGYRIVVGTDGATRTLDVAPSQSPFTLSAGAGPAGAPWLLWSRCNADERQQSATDCDVQGYDLGTNTPLSFPFAAQPGVIERAPAVDGGQLAWATGRAGGRATIHVAATDGSGAHAVAALPATTCELSFYGDCFKVTRSTVQSTAIAGSLLAVASRVSTNGGDVGICGLGNVRIYDLGRRFGRTLDTTTCGLSGTALTDLGFDAGGALWWRQSCSGDESACGGTSAGPFRYAAGRVQRLVNDARSNLRAVAVAGMTPVIAQLTSRTAPGCWTGDQGLSGYRCGKVAAVGAAFADVKQRRPAPPSDYTSVESGARLWLLEPPPSVPCSRGDLRPKAGATLWAGSDWRTSKRAVAGPAIAVSAASGGRVVRGSVGASKLRGARFATLDLGGPAKACGRTWKLTYAVPGRAPVRLQVRVRAR